MNKNKILFRKILYNNFKYILGSKKKDYFNKIVFQIKKF